METWILLTVFAAFMQNVRSVLQKSLKGELGTTGATFVRFLYALPVAGIYLAVLVLRADSAAPPLDFAFGTYVLVGGVAQIIGTALLVSLFDQRSFAVATTYSKTEAVQAAIFAAIFLGEGITGWATVGILVSLGGVIAMSLARTTLIGDASDRHWRERAAAVGLGSGASFALAAVAYRGASISLPDGHFMMRSAMTLFFVLLFQTLAMGLYMAARAQLELRACLSSWRIASWVGLTGALASIGWFSAMTLQNAALVRSVGQVELLFTVASSAILFRERILPVELVGMALVAAGILILVLG